MVFITLKIKPAIRYNSYKGCLDSDKSPNILFTVIVWLTGNYQFPRIKQLLKATKYYYRMKITLKILKSTN